MGLIFDILGSIFGYILWFFFDLVNNYGLAITLFTITINMVMFPLAISRQKSMTKNSKLAVKQQELKKKYEKNPKKYNEEVSKLYEKEGMSPLNGCFSAMVLPLILWGGVIGAVTKPLQNTLHISSEKIVSANSVIQTIPGISSTYMQGYEQLQLVKLFSNIKPYLTIFSESELQDISEFSSGFKFMGLNLLDRPNSVPFSDMLWIVPLVCFLSSILSMYVTQKFSGSTSNMQGCAKYMPYGMFIFTAYIAYTIPAAVGLYWIVNSIINMLQSLILNVYYNAYTINAKEESKRFEILKNNGM